MIPNRAPSSPMVGIRPMSAPLAGTLAQQPAGAGREPEQPRPPVFNAVEENGVVKFKEAPPAAMELDAAPEGSPQFRTISEGGTGFGPVATPKADAPSPALMLTQLQQFITVTARARVQSKAAADLLLDKGLVAEAAGFLVITKKGIVYLADFGML